MTTLADRVDPELPPAMEMVAEKLGPDFMGSPDAVARREKLAAFVAALGPMERRHPEVIRERLRLEAAGGQGADVDVILYRPPNAPTPAPAILYIHGGGYSVGGAEESDGESAELAARLGVVVVSVDYRLAPEHRHPAALDDCYAALCRLARDAVDLKVDAQRIALFGASAGGGLAANVALRARDEGGPAPCFQMLCYPMLDDRAPSPPGWADETMWGRGANREAWTALLGAAEEGKAPPPHAAAARAHDLSRLPTTFIDVGGLDILLEQNLAYAQRLIAAEVEVELHIYPGAYHGFDMFNPLAAVSRRAARTRLDALAARLGVHSS